MPHPVAGHCLLKRPGHVLLPNQILKYLRPITTSDDNIFSAASDIRQVQRLAGVAHDDDEIANRKM
jgi:hypothetical protein